MKENCVLKEKLRRTHGGYWYSSDLARQRILRMEARRKDDRTKVLAKVFLPPVCVSESKSSRNIGSLSLMLSSRYSSTLSSKSSS